MLPTRRFKPVSVILLVALVLFAEAADASHSIAALGAFYEGLHLLAIIVVGFALLICLVVAYLSVGKRHRGVPVYVWVLLALYTFLVVNRFSHPRLDIETATIVCATWLVYLGSFYLLKNRKSAHLAALAMIFVSTALLLTDPVILSFKNHVYSDDIPIADDLQATEIMHPVFSNVWSANRFLQTSDGALYYGQRFFGKNYRSGALMRQTATSCDAACRHCGGNCFEFYAVRNNRKAFARPTAIIDFQGKNNFPEGDQPIPFALINIPLEDAIVNPYYKARIGTLKLVSDASQRETWDVASYWLWSEVCGGGIRDNVAELMIASGADPNYSAESGGETTFNCAVRHRSLKQIALFARNGADPNIESKENRIHFRHPTAMFLAMHRYMELEDKVELFRLLIDIGVHLNARHKDGETLLHRVVADPYLRERVELTRILLSFGVNPDIAREDGQTPLDLAKSRRHKLLGYSNQSTRDQQDLSELDAIIALLAPDRTG